MGMTPLLTDPLRWGWGTVFAGVLVLHVRHARRRSGAHRLWHGGHAVMAAAMACMLLPGELGTTPAPLWFIGAGGAAGAALVHALLRHCDGARVGMPWVTLAVGPAATAYMCLMTAGIAAAPMTYAAVSWLACEALGWFAGALRGRLGEVRARPVPAQEKRLAPATTAADRLALGLLALGMAYLFVAMGQLPMGH
jgi:hypothetical protein